MLRIRTASLDIAILIFTLEVPQYTSISLTYLISIAESKYSHAAVWGLIPGYDLPDGRRHYPLAAMVANLAKPTPDRPALMTHDDVVTFFHEMGHVFHGLLSRTRSANLSPQLRVPFLLVL
jgi:Zn-dependent oligopeptidase